MHLTHETNIAVEVSKKPYNICQGTKCAIMGLVIGARQNPEALIPCKIHVLRPELEILVFYDRTWCPILL